MPYTVNGIGTSVCRARGDILWDPTRLPAPMNSTHDGDAVECFVLLYLPLIPLRAVHTFDWNGNQYRSIPIRFGLGLFARAFLRRVTAIAMVFLFFAALGVTFAKNETTEQKLQMAPYLGAVAVALLASHLLLQSTDRRNKDIRYVLGQHGAGSSDPATWKPDMLSRMSSPQQLYGTLTFAEAAAQSLQQGHLARAMWAARLCAALEDRREGERLTDEVLDHPDVRSALVHLKRNPAEWNSIMTTATRKSA
jgi:hypothetical protein